MDIVEVPKRALRLFLAVALLTFAVYLFSARGIPTTYDEQIIFDTTAALVHGRSYIPDTPVLDRLPGLSVKRPDGRKAGIYGIGTSVVAAPFYEAGKVLSHLVPPSHRAQFVVSTTLFTDALITAASVLMLMLVCFLLGAPPPGCVLIGVSFGLASYAYPHAGTLFTEPGTALCVITAVWFAIRAARGGRRSDLVACGAFAATALLFRISAGLFLPVFGIWILVAGARTRDVRRVVRFGAWFAAGAVGPLALLLAVNAWRYGSATNLGYPLSSGTSSTYPILRGLAGQWISSGKSLFLYAPIAAIAVLGIVRAAKRLPLEMCLLGSIVLLNTLFFARVQFWSGDWAWGPRYMQIVLPCLAAMAAPLMDSRVWRRALGAVSVYGFLFAALPAVAIRFTLIFTAAYHTMPPANATGGPAVWDHSYYALIWHTLHWQPILYTLRQIPDAFTNALSVARAGGGAPRLEFWWLRRRDIGSMGVVLYALFTLGVLVVAVRLLGRSLFGDEGHAAGDDADGEHADQPDADGEGAGEPHPETLEPA